eukprot:TRINITY_DN31036_c0_g1_i1.p2 TRINITY_DN31036_c0_g1~~TRINITY_DN31036_c0_g1_i1.p2  ORF type:complete len:104 (+),score=4.65 TRINITY_DN31036_c0_g1_i1:131-442(+)
MLLTSHAPVTPCEHSCDFQVFSALLIFVLACWDLMLLSGTGPWFCSEPVPPFCFLGVACSGLFGDDDISGCIPSRRRFCFPLALVLFSSGLLFGDDDVSVVLF